MSSQLKNHGYTNQAAEHRRVLAEYSRRDAEIPADLYHPLNPAELWMRHERLAEVASLAAERRRTPSPGDRVLEIGCGRLGWLADCLAWGIEPEDLHGLELNPESVQIATRRFPNSVIVCGDACELPWGDGAFDVSILSTVVSSVLDPTLRSKICAEASRVTSGGIVLWYDLAVNNPKNPRVRRINQVELKRLFPDALVFSRKTTLAPPILRRSLKASRTLTQILNTLPLLRTHMTALIEVG